MIDQNRLLDEPPEEHPSAGGHSPVEPERELIEVIAQMLLGNSAMMYSQEPPLDQRRHLVNAGQYRLRSLLPLASQSRWVMDVSDFFEPVITVPSIRNDFGAENHHSLHKAVELRDTRS